MANALLEALGRERMETEGRRGRASSTVWQREGAFKNKGIASLRTITEIRKVPIGLVCR